MSKDTYEEMLEELVYNYTTWQNEYDGNAELYFATVEKLVERDRMLVEALKQIVSVWPTRDMMVAYNVAWKALKAIGEDV